MKPLYVVLLQSDARIAERLASALSNTSCTVHHAGSLTELRRLLAQHQSCKVILDIEAASLPELQHLCKQFPHTYVVCTHRLADENMWTAAMNAGASDICASSDIPAIVRSAVGSMSSARSAVAA
jgi:DNA-binding NtrC family response regulator